MRQHLQNLRIGTRLALGFTLILVLATVATSSALVIGRSATQSTERMMEKPLAKERVVADWYVMTFAAIARTSMIARSSDSELSTTFAKPIAESVEKTSGLVKKLEPLLESDEEKALFKSIHETRATYQAAKVAVMNAKKAGNAD
ncbi:MAG TPA: MCP four helix bundle domain-containing protein, partial [Telluria sp.]|nr:MCP four helix bundle domain-containing protein [Telluria sp.]